MRAAWRAALDAEDLQRLADALVDGVRRNAELGRDFLRDEMLVDEHAGSRAGPRSGARRAGRSHYLLRSVRIVGGIGTPAVSFNAIGPRKHCGTPRATSPGTTLLQIPPFDQFSAVFRQFPLSALSMRRYVRWTTVGLPTLHTWRATLCTVLELKAPCPAAAGPRPSASADNAMPKTRSTSSRSRRISSATSLRYWGIQTWPRQPS